MSKPEDEGTTILEFVLRLHEDSKLLTEFNEDPDKTMLEAGINSEENRKIMKSGNLLRLSQLLISINKSRLAVNYKI
jgi:hypothetical protein